MDEIRVIALPPYGMCGEVSYIICGGGKAAVVDAPGNNREILSAVEREGLKLEKILLTHGHFDHIAGLAELAGKTGAEVYIHKADVPLLGDDFLNLSELFGEPPVKKYTGGIYTVEDGDSIDVCGCKGYVLHTPGHTEGSVMYIIGSAVFSGDTLFRDSIGRTDMPGGSEEVMRGTLKMIAERKWELEDYALYPGHSMPSSVRRELERNPYLRGNADYRELI